MVPFNFQHVRLAQHPRKFAELCQDFTPSYKVSIFIIECLVAHQFSDFKAIQQYWNCLVFKNELDLSDTKSATWIDRTLNLICQTNQQRGSTDSIQATSGIA